MAANNSNSKRQGAVEILTALASSGDTWVKLSTLLLVAITGLGNFFATEHQGQRNRSDIDRQTQEIWRALDRNKEDFRRLVKDAAESRSNIGITLEKQSQSLQNQEQMLRNQQNVLMELQRWQQNYKNPTQPGF